MATEAAHKKLTLIEVTSLGVGTMIGAGIFALFGEISTLAGGYAWLAFIAAGIVSALAGYAYYVLSKRAQTNGGIAEYLTLGWDANLIGSTISLCYFLAIAIVLGLVAKSFGHYTVKVLSLSDSMVNPLAIAVMLLFLLVNATGIKFMGKAEKILVITKLVVLSGFTLISLAYFNSATYADNQHAVSFNFGNFINAVALANLSFAGFGVIANATGSVHQDRNIIGYAILIAIALVAVIYIALDIAVFGSVKLSQIEQAKDYALAEAARPVLGHLGFLLLGITAIISTTTNINANIFSASNVMSYMAEERQMSPVLSRRLFLRQGNIATIVTVGIVIAMVLTLDLGQIGDVASLTFLLVHSFIPLGMLLHPHKDDDANTLLIWLSVLSNGGLMVFFIFHLSGKNGPELLIFAGVIAFAFVFELISTRILKTRADQVRE